MVLVPYMLTVMLLAKFDPTVGRSLSTAVITASTILFSWPARAQEFDSVSIEQQAKSSSFGYPVAESPHAAITADLIEQQQFELAIKLYKHWLFEPNPASDISKLSDAMHVLRLQVEQSVWQEQNLASNRRAYADIKADVTAVANDSRQLLLKKLGLSDEGFPAASDVQLCFDFAIDQGLAELARHLTAAKLATLDNQTLNRSATEAIRDCLDRLNEAEKQTRERISIVAGQQISRRSTSWLNELHRLGNEQQLLQIDLLAMRLELQGDDPEQKIAASTNLISAIERVTTSLSNEKAFSPRLNRLKAIAMAKLGRRQEAVDLLKNDALLLTDLTQLQENLLTRFSLLMQGNDQASSAGARAILFEVLEQTIHVDPHLALAVYQYNLERFAQRGAGNIDSDITSNDPLLRLERKSLAEQIKQTATSQSLTRLKQLIGERFGQYWAYRCESLLLSQSARARNGNADQNAAPLSGSVQSSTALLLIDAQIKQLLLAGDVPAAIQKTEQAEQVAIEQKDRERAFSFASKRLAIFHRALSSKTAEAKSDVDKQAGEAAELSLAQRFHNVAMEYVEQPEANKLSFLSIAMLQGLNKRLPNTEQDKDDSITARLLEYSLQHVISFASADSTSQVLDHAIQIEVDSGAFQAAADLVSANLLALKTQAGEESSARLTELRDRRAAYLIANTFAGNSKLNSAIASRVGQDEWLVNDAKAVAIITDSLYWLDMDRINSRTLEWISTSGCTLWLKELAMLKYAIATQPPALPLRLSSEATKWFDLSGNDLKSNVAALAIGNNIANRLYLSYKNCDATWLTVLGQSIAVCHDAGNGSDENSAVTRQLQTATERLTAYNLAYRGDTEAALELWKQVANRQNSTTVLADLGRLLCLGTKEQAAAANNLWRRLTRGLSPQAINYWTMQGDAIYAITKSESIASARTQLATLQALGNPPEAWTRKVEAMLVDR